MGKKRKMNDLYARQQIGLIKNIHSSHRTYIRYVRRHIKLIARLTVISGKMKGNNLKPTERYRGSLGLIQPSEAISKNNYVEKTYIIIGEKNEKTCQRFEGPIYESKATTSA